MSAQVTIETLEKIAGKTINNGVFSYGTYAASIAGIDQKLYQHLGPQGTIKMLITNPDTIAAQPAEQRGTFIISGLEKLSLDHMIYAGWHPRTLDLLSKKDKRSYAQTIYDRLEQDRSNARSAYDLGKFLEQDWVLESLTEDRLVREGLLTLKDDKKHVLSGKALEKQTRAMQLFLQNCDDKELKKKYLMEIDFANSVLKKSFAAHFENATVDNFCGERAHDMARLSADYQRLRGLKENVAAKGPNIAN